jgi:hypothetical protein
MEDRIMRLSIIKAAPVNPARIRPGLDAGGDGRT